MNGSCDTTGHARRRCFECTSAREVHQPNEKHHARAAGRVQAPGSVPRGSGVWRIRCSPLALAGIRADGLMSLAFPAAAAQTVALNDMRGQKVRWPLTVAGTAQAGRVAALPVSRLTAHASARAGTKRAHTIARLALTEAFRTGVFLTLTGAAPTLARTLVLACTLCACS